MSRRPAGAIPRRFPDGRSALARRWRAVYRAITSRYQPGDDLGREVAAVVADLLLDYEQLRGEKEPPRGHAGALRKSVGLIWGGLSRLERLVGRNGDGHGPADALEAIKAKVQAARQGGAS